jgi:hypothetical protein
LPPGTNWINDCNEHSWNGASRLPHRRHGWAGNGHEDIWCVRDQFGRISAITFGITGGPANLDANISAIGPAQSLKALHERRYAGLSLAIVLGKIGQHANAAHAFAQLCTRSERPCDRRTAK